jgi:hypothetical protein
MCRATKEAQWRGEANLPFFVCGGGANIPLYAELPQQAWRGLLQNQSQVKIRNLPKPEKFRTPDMADGDFHRLAVAWGLSYPDLGNIALPKGIEDMLPPGVTAEHQKKYVGKEQT